MKINMKKLSNIGIIVLFIYLILQTAISVSFPFRYSIQKVFFQVSAFISFFIAVKYTVSYVKNKDTVYLYLFLSVSFIIISLFFAGSASFSPKQEILYKDGDLEYYAYPGDVGWKNRTFTVQFHLKDQTRDQFMFEKPSFTRSYDYEYYDDITLSLDKHYEEHYYRPFNYIEINEGVVEEDIIEITENEINQGKVVSDEELNADSEKIISKDNKYYYLKVVDVAMNAFQIEIYESLDQVDWISLGELPYYDEIYDIQVQGEFVFLAFPPINDQAQIISTKDFKEFHDIELLPLDEGNVFLESVLFEKEEYFLTVSSPRWNESTNRTIYKSKDGVKWEYFKNKVNE